VDLSNPQTVAVVGVLIAFGAFALSVFSALARFIARQLFLRRRRFALLKVATIRTEGVRLRNEGMAITTDARLQVWIHEVEHWETRAIAGVSEFERHEGEVFRTVDRWAFEGVDDLLRPVRDEASGQMIDRAVSAEHRMQVGLLSARLRELKDLLHRYSPS